MVLGKAICSSESSSTVSKEYDGNDDKNGSYKNNSNFSVLVVDDDKVARTIHKLMLKAHGMEVQVADNGKEAVDFHVAGASFDLILMDMAMPIMNGFQATMELRDMGIISPIVGVTTSNRATEMKMFVEVGVDDCVSKPLNIDKIASFLSVSIATTATSTNAATSVAAATPPTTAVMNTTTTMRIMITTVMLMIAAVELAVTTINLPHEGNQTDQFIHKFINLEQ